MRAHESLRVLCRRHGVPVSYGRRLLPLLVRAHAAPPEIRDRLLRLVELNLLKEARRRASLGAQAHGEADRALHAVARALHAWEPPSWLERWVDRPTA